MMTNKRRQGLLNNDKAQLYLNDEEEDFAEIQMADLQARKINLTNYTKLNDSADLEGHFYHKIQNVQSNHQHLQLQPKMYAEKPTVPITSFNLEPNKIQINGVAFVHKNAIKGAIKTEHKTKQPQMEVTCEACATPQNVPANTNSFICFDCDCVQVCVPQYGIFICGNCQKKVWYPLGTSNLIRCGKCWTINKIPGEENYFPKPSPYLHENQVYEKKNDQKDEDEKFYPKRYPM